MALELTHAVSHDCTNRMRQGDGGKRNVGDVGDLEQEFTKLLSHWSVGHLEKVKTKIITIRLSVHHVK